MERDKLDQIKRVLRAGAAVVLIACLTLMFTNMWKATYNMGVVFPFYNKGHWMVAAIYVIFLILFFYIYGGLKFGYLKCTSLILSQALAMVCANALTYLEIVLLSAKFVDIIPMLVLTIEEVAMIIVWAVVTTKMFAVIFPPRRILVLYEEYDPKLMECKMKRRNDRYKIERSQNIRKIEEEDLHALIKEYDAVLIYDVHSVERNKILKFCYSESVRVYLTPKLSDILIKSSETNHLFDSPLFMLRNNGFTFEQRVVKRIMDIVISMIVLIITSPIMLVTAIMIKVYDGGPVMFRQERCTINGKVFKIHKFRSMIVDAEKNGQVIPATEKDPRITPIGSFIRKTRIDELPQMLDILEGNMSVVGPRPERVEHVKAYTEDIPEFAYRLKVKGGLTGVAQIYGKYNTTAYDKLKLDLMYIQNYSILMDIRLIFMTIKIMFMKESTEGFDAEVSENMGKREEKSE